MIYSLPTIIALDFDGVICDGLKEYFATTKRAYEQIWQQNLEQNLQKLEISFYKLRPVIETGWEMPVLLRAIILEIDESEILTSWNLVRDQIVATEKLDTKLVGNTLDSMRDDWITDDLTSWLELHRFYPGILEIVTKIISSSSELYIVTTKEGRFVQQLLQQQEISLPRDQIIGKESKRPKYETLRLLRDSSENPDVSFWFVEDRLPALQLVKQQPDLKPIVKLFMADWGYNIERDRLIASNDPDIELISLEELTQKF
ncbi:MAG: HAD hydrolase-like protein [Xenococcaceae cyanobacterium MO_207.B15]|nr:HAD hydrolase-like protein [Xenococcaceae cyanobacterium MO_207.B15]